MRAAIAGLDRYIATCRTATHRVFTFLPAAILPESTIIAIASTDAFHLGVLSSRISVAWSRSAGSHLGVGNDSRYNNTLVFEPFPFPDPSKPKREWIASSGETLDAHRKARQAAHPDLTLTGMYNVLEKLRSGAELAAKDTVIHEKGLVSVLKKLHDDLDASVLDAYGWPRDLTDEQIVERLVALNAERAAEEKKGLVRWLRPEFQAPESTAGKAARAAKPKQQSLIDEEPAAKPQDGEPAAWPKELSDRMLAVRAALRRGRTMTAREVAKSFPGRADRDRADSITEVLVALRALGQALAVEGSGETRWTSTGRV